MDPDDLDSILRLDELQALRRDNPRALMRHLDTVRRGFLFGVEDDAEREDGDWGGDFRVLINRNVTLHLLPGFREGAASREELPQFVVMPDPDRADAVEEHSVPGDADERLPARIFWIDPLDYDALAREAQEIAAQYRGWDLIPDTYYLHTELVRFVARTVLEEAQVRAEREFDFRMGVVGGAEPPPLDEDEMLTAEQLMEPEDEGAGEDEGEDDEPPLSGMRSHPVEWGGD